MRPTKKLIFAVALFVFATIVSSCREGTIDPDEPDVVQDGFPASELKAVDLGLSVKWANMNVGAKNELEYGDKYAWGETSTKSDFTKDNYKYSKTITYKYKRSYEEDVYTDSEEVYSKYWTRPVGEGLAALQYNVECDFAPDMLTTLESSDDAASKSLGGKWRTPTKEEWEELFTKCKFSNDVYIDGLTRQYLLVVTGPNGNEIVFAVNKSNDLSKDTYQYWSNTLNEKKPEQSILADIQVSSITTGKTKEYDRFSGLLIRAVQK